jgi:DNA-binding NarL/FixJ family response regulator
MASDVAATVRIIIAEDNMLVREGVRGVLDSQPGFTVVALCEDYDGLLAAAEEHNPDVVVTDVRMPPGFADEGIRAATELRAQRPDLGVVVLSQYADPAYALPLFAEGSEGRAYLLKERVSEPAQLAEAVRAVASGGSVIDPKIVEALVSSRSAQPASPLDQLTAREREVLEQIAQGKNNAAVAAALFLTERAVEKHINALFAKLRLTEEPDTNRRVKAVLLYLAERSSAAPGG